MVSILLRLVVDKLLRHAGRPAVCKSDSRPDGRRVSKHEVDLFQVAAHGFGVEEEDAQWDASANAGKDNVKLPSNGVDSNRRDHDNDKVPGVPC